jgi:hypothetical protein
MIFWWQRTEGCKEEGSDEEGYYYITTQAYDDGVMAGSSWMDNGGDNSSIPYNPYSGDEAKEWENGFNVGAGEHVF